MESKVTEGDVVGAAVVSGIVMAVMGFAIGLATANNVTNSWWERTTVSKGFAEYVTDKQDGIDWQWKESK